jgi:hypothetical protein
LLKLGIILFAGFMLAVVAMMLKMHLQAIRLAARHIRCRELFSEKARE